MSAAGRGPIAVLVAVLGVVLVVSGCARGNSEGAGAASPGLPKYYSAADLLTVVAARQRADRTAVLRLSGRVDGPSGPTTLGGDGSLRIEPTGGVSAQFTQTLTAPGGTPQTARFVVTGSGQVFRDTGGSWTRVDHASTGTPDKTLATTAANVADTADPTANLARYSDAALIADAVDQPVDGVAAVRYLVVVDLVRAADLQTDPIIKAELRSQVDGGLTRISSTLWVDAANRPLRSENRQALPGIGTLTLTADYRDWGAPVSIAAPSL
ncbi:hypothetical protein GCM10009836_66500 [Pseudonocardia ailaonensis]|uniref:LppX_LprAFG lipoprotein n=1 Tax=Pseudonocardia ailaonensis TaxID=367279 RepID=A0ABN2NN72_9PSEU